MNYLTGKKFNRLTVLRRNGSSKDKHAMWLCKCDCGNETVVRSDCLRIGKIQSCGCLRNELVGDRGRTHGMTETRLYRTWCGMKNRCYNPSYKGYKNYGGRGITICSEWLHDFQAFYDWAMANSYKENLTIERKDVNGNYCPENCCWITKKMQSRNRTDNRKITCKSQTMILTDWANLLGVNRSTLAYKLKNSDLSEAEVIENLLKETEVQA